MFYFSRRVPSCHADWFCRVIQQFRQYGDTGAAQCAVLAPAHWDVTTCFCQVSESSSPAAPFTARTRLQLWTAPCLVAGERPAAGTLSQRSCRNSSLILWLRSSCVWNPFSWRNLNSTMAVFEKDKCVSSYS